MSLTRDIAILRADPLVGSAFPKPILIARVIARAKPSVDDVLVLARHGGFAVRFLRVPMSDPGTLADAIGRACSDELGCRPAFVDMTTGALFATHGTRGEAARVVEIGNLYDAFGPRPIGEPGQAHATTFTARDRTVAVAAVLEGKPDLAEATAADAIATRTPLAMTAGEILRTLVGAIAGSASRYRQAAGGTGAQIALARRTGHVDGYQIA
jgi:hypothetical protein